MNSLFPTLLILHVFSGLAGVILFYILWLSLLGRRPSIGLWRFSSLTGLVSFLVSWLTGGYYYVYRYGSAVKPLIKQGPFPLAHAVFMEAKEHIFLFLPFLALVLFLAIWLKGETLAADGRIKRPLSWLSGSVFLLGALVTLFGVIVSGAAR